MLWQMILASALITAGLLWSILRKKLTVAAAVCGAVAGIVLFVYAGLAALLFMTVFFLLGTAATSYKKAAKQKITFYETSAAPRNTAQVFANAGMPLIVTLYGWYYSLPATFINALIAACFASATADTLSSELGMVYGKRMFNIISFKNDERGNDGVISVEGLLIGIAGSAIIALIFSWFFSFDFSFLHIVVAGTAGNIADSILGATLERKKLIGNNLVNFLNTIVAAIVMWLFIK